MKHHRIIPALAAKVRQVREEAGYTQEQVADVLQMRRVSISDIERGRVAVSVWYLTQLSILTDKPIGSFFEELL